MIIDDTVEGAIDTIVDIVHGVSRYLQDNKETISILDDYTTKADRDGEPFYDRCSFQFFFWTQDLG